MKKLRTLLALLIVLVTVVVLAACGQNNPTTDPTDPPASGAAQGDESTGRKASNSVVVGIAQDLDSLDPHSAAYAGTREVLFNLFEGLVKATSEGGIEPAVAEEFTVAEDASSITFVLRNGICFCDGTPVTVDDIKYSIERYAEIQGESSAFGDFKDIEVLSDTEVKINLDKPNSEFIYELTCAILPAWNDADQAANPIGTGPFKYKSFTPGEAFVTVKNENYWKAGVPYLDEVTYKIVADSETAVLQLNAGTLDIFQYLDQDAADALSDDFYLATGTVNYVHALYLNNGRAPFDNILVRKAMCYAIDRDLVNTMVCGGKSHIIGTNMVPSAAKYYNAATETVYTHDVEKAKELLKEAGYPDGFEFTITVPNNYAPHEGAAQVIKECLAEVGITAIINTVEFTTWHSEAYTDRNYDATIVAVDGRLAPNSWFVKNVSTGAKNFTNYSNPEFDQTFEAALAEIDLDKKVEHYNKLQMILAEDAASVYIQDPVNLVAVNNALEGYIFYPVSAQDMSVVKYK
ncbi:MAG: ABC transporter substrate-binding protein [Parasporobacterium sp.]|nr:ABC transporter substrate-binding protein [Parasporobacterium sp.]